MSVRIALDSVQLLLPDFMLYTNLLSVLFRAGVGVDVQEKARANWTVNTHIFDNILKNLKVVRALLAESLSSFVQYFLKWAVVLNVGWMKVKSCKWINSAKVKEYGQFVLNLCFVKVIWWYLIWRWSFSCLGASKSSNWCKWWVWHNAASGWTRKQERCVLIYRVAK